MTGGDTTPHRQILGSERVDDLGEAILALTRELWVLSDRQAVLEAVLAEQGIDISAVETYQPDDAMAEKLETRRQQLIDNVLVALRAG